MLRRVGLPFYFINWAYNVCFFYRDWILSDSICNRIWLLWFIFFFTPKDEDGVIKIVEIVKAIWFVCGLIKFASFSLIYFDFNRWWIAIIIKTTIAISHLHSMWFVCTINGWILAQKTKKKHTHQNDWSIDRIDCFHTRSLCDEISTAIECECNPMWKYGNFVNLSASISSTRKCYSNSKQPLIND